MKGQTNDQLIEMMFEVEINVLGSAKCELFQPKCGIFLPESCDLVRMDVESRMQKNLPCSQKLTFFQTEHYCTLMMLQPQQHTHNTCIVTPILYYPATNKFITT